MLLLLALYLLVGAAAIAAVRWLRRPAPLRYALVFWLLPVVFAFPGFFADRTILPVDHAMLILPWAALGPAERHNANLNDIATHMAPWAKAVRMAWKEGSLPWRQRWNGCGMALAANGQSAAFSPFTFLMFALPLARAFTLAAAVKLFLALFGMWLWLRELGISRTSALFGGVSFGLSCAMTPWILFPHTSVICLWPWALFAVEVLREERVGGRAFWAVTAILFLWALGGHPESALLGAVFTALWLLARAWLRDLPRAGNVIGRVALAGAIALGLSAFLLVPEALAIAHSSRIPVAREFARNLPARAVPHGPIWPNGLVTAMFPQALGDSVTSPMIAGAVGSFPEMALGYFGILGWAVALSILRPGSRRKRGEYALLVPFVAGLAVAVMLWPFFEIAVRTPVLKMMFFLRYFSWVPLGGAAIAAFELDRLRADSLAGRKGTFAFLGVLAGAAVYAAVVYSRFRPLHAASGRLASQTMAFAVAWVCLGAAAALFLAARSRPDPFRMTVFSVCLSAVAAAELLYQGARLYRFGSPQDLYPDTPMLAFLRSRPGPFRVVGEGTVLFPNTNIFAGVEDIRTKDPVERLDYVEFLNATCGYPPADEFKQIRDVNASALDFLNVRYLVSVPGRVSPAEKWRLVYSGGDGTVFENRDALPRVFAPAHITLVAGAEHGLGGSPNAWEAFGTPASAIAAKKDWREHAFVLSRESAVITNGAAEVSGYRESTNKVSFRARISGPEALLVASLEQDGGWSARDESGRTLHTSLANGPFLAIRVPGGDHAVVLKYAPPGLGIGVWITAASLLGTAPWWARAVVLGLSGGRARVRLWRPADVFRKVDVRLVWQVGAAMTLILGLASSKLLVFRAFAYVPETPLDLTNAAFARQWRFLKQMRARLPAGVSYTVRASTLDEEMVLYMLSLGLFEKQQALPSSYFGVPESLGSEAEYVLEYGEVSSAPGEAHLVFRSAEGALYKRTVHR